MNKENQPQICYYCSSESFGGLEMNIVRMLGWLKSAGYPVLFFVPPNSPVEKYALEEDLEISHIEVNKKYFDFKRAKKISKLLKQNNVQLLFVGATRDVAFGTLIKRIYYRKLKLIYHSQMQIGISKRGLVHTLRYEMLDKWIVPLPYLKKEVGEQTRFPIEKVDVIPLCVDSAYYTEFTKSKEECRKELHLPSDLPFIGILGRIDPLKRQDFLVRALHQLHQDNEKAGLVIMGEPTRNTSDGYYQNLKKSITEFGLNDYVYFLPFSKETRPFFRAIDLFAMTTRGETFGMVTVEAMVNKVPVAACNSGGSIEILENGNLGILYTLDDLADFCNKSKEILKDKETALKRSQSAFNIAVEKYDKKVQVEAFIHIIEEYLK